MPARNAAFTVVSFATRLAIPLPPLASFQLVESTLIESPMSDAGSVAEVFEVPTAPAGALKWPWT